MKVPGLFDEAVSNELLFLGSMNNILLVIVYFIYVFLRSMFYIRLAKAKIWLKMGSPYEILNDIHWTNQISFCDKKRRIFYCWGNCSGNLSVTMPKQNQSYIRCPILNKTFIYYSKY